LEHHCNNANWESWKNGNWVLYVWFVSWTFGKSRLLCYIYIYIYTYIYIFFYMCFVKCMFLHVCIFLFSLTCGTFWHQTSLNDSEISGERTSAEVSLGSKKQRWYHCHIDNSTNSCGTCVIYIYIYFLYYIAFYALWFFLYVYC